MKVTDKPECWVILEITNNDEKVYKVFGGWLGGYTQGDSWRANSGISSVDEDENNYYFHGYSGSCYQCHKKAYGLKTSYLKGVLVDILNGAAGVQNVKINVMDEDSDFKTLISL